MAGDSPIPSDVLLRLSVPSMVATFFATLIGITVYEHRKLVATD
jgi:hypothetical protein